MVLGEISTTTVMIIDNDGMNYSCVTSQLYNMHYDIFLSS